VKISKAQAEMLRLMYEGWTLKFITVTHSWVLKKEGVTRAFPNKLTVKALQRKELIYCYRFVSLPNNGDWRLTHTGREIAEKLGGD